MGEVDVARGLHSTKYRVLAVPDSTAASLILTTEDIGEY